MKQLWAFDFSNGGRGGQVYLTVASSKNEAVANIEADIMDKWGNRSYAMDTREKLERMEPTVARSLDYYIGE